MSSQDVPNYHMKQAAQEIAMRAARDRAVCIDIAVWNEIEVKEGTDADFYY